MAGPAILIGTLLSLNPNDWSAFATADDASGSPRKLSDQQISTALEMYPIVEQGLSMAAEDDNQDPEVTEIVRKTISDMCDVLAKAKGGAPYDLVMAMIAPIVVKYQDWGKLHRYKPNEEWRRMKDQLLMKDPMKGTVAERALGAFTRFVVEMQNGPAK